MSEEKVIRIEEVEGMLRRTLDEQNEKSLRDWFAGMAMQGLLSNPSIIDTLGKYHNIIDTSFSYADAMLKERENHENN